MTNAQCQIGRCRGRVSRPGWGVVPAGGGTPPLRGYLEGMQNDLGKERTLGRKQFTFYRSFYEAMMLLPKRQRLDFVQAVIEYALDGVEPEFRYDQQKGQFVLIRPILNTARSRSASGILGFERTKAKRKGKGKDKEEEKKEDEKEIEIETEIETETDKARACGFDSFWELYPKKIGRDDARRAYMELEAEPEVILKSLKIWCGCALWQKEDGRFIPHAEKWLRQRYFEEVPAGYVPRGAIGELGEAELEAIRMMLSEDQGGNDGSVQ